MAQADEIYIPPGGPPQGTPPSRHIWAAMGEANIFKMLEDFYLLLSRSSIQHMFPDEIIPAAHKSAAFFVGLLGGPPLYQQRYGSPMLRARHMPFPIAEVDRQEWLRCFDEILDQAEDKYAFPAEHLPGFRAFLHEFSGWMVNRKDE